MASGGDNPDAKLVQCESAQSCGASGNPCLVAVCADGVCQERPAEDGTACDDQVACTEADACRAGTCEGKARVCDDGLTCSKDSCDATTGACLTDVTTCACTKDADCDDKNACTGAETCDPVARTCLNGAKVSCASLDNACNVGMCNPTDGTCTALPKAAGSVCDDNNACTKDDVCAQGACAGAAITCTATDQCHTAGVCDPASGQCSNPTQPNGTTCEDGNRCTRGDACSDGSCAAGAGTTCTASGECRVAGTCDPATGMCSDPLAVDGAICNDGSACTNGDKCAAGVCKGAAIACDDGLACTVDSCSEAAGCTKDVRLCGCQKNSDCDDGNACNGSETCNVQSLTCVAGTAKDCSGASNACNVGVCNATSGACEARPRQNGTACNDGTACTRVDTCVDGQCRGQNPVVCTASDQCHVAGACDAQTGTCSNPPKANGAACNDDNACTQTDACQNGGCLGSTPVTCTAASQCHNVGTCNPQTGTCSMPTKPNGTSCNDGNACTRTDSCQSGICGGGNPLTCVALNQCHAVGVCDASSGTCSNPVKADGAACNDNNGCSLADKCTAGTCGGTAVSCSTPPVCQQGGMCVGNGMCVYQNVADRTTCDDGQGCTIADACSTGKCTGSRRSNKPGDWNLTPTGDKGLVGSVNLDDFSKGTVVAGTFLGTVGFGSFNLSVVRSTGAYVAFYAIDKTVVAAHMVMQASTSLVVSDVTVHEDGSFVLVGQMTGAVAFPSDAKQRFTTEGGEWFVAAFDRNAGLRWVRRGARGNGVAVTADSYANRSVIVVGTSDKPLAFDDGGGKIVALNNAGTVAAIYDDEGFLKSAGVVASQGLLGLKVSVSPQTDLAAVQGTGAGEVVIGGTEGFAALGGKDVFVFALTPDLETVWARQLATGLDDETGGVAAYPGKTGSFVSFWSGTGPKATLRGRNMATTPLHGFDGRGLQGHLVTFNKDGTPINAALVANRNGSSVRAWDVRSQAQDGRFTVVGTFNVGADVYGVAGFGDGPPTSNPDRTVTHNVDGDSVFAARFDGDAIKNTWAVNLRGTKAGLGANGNDMTLTVHPDLSATATGMFTSNASFGDQVVDALAAGQGTFFLSHFNAAAEYDYCQ